MDPDRCRLSVDRRLAPGEDPDAALAEFDQGAAICAEVAQRFAKHPAAGEPAR